MVPHTSITSCIPTFSPCHRPCCDETRPAEPHFIVLPNHCHTAIQHCAIRHCRTAMHQAICYCCVLLVTQSHTWSQDELGEGCVSVVVSWDAGEGGAGAGAGSGGQVHFEAFQCTKQVVGLVKEGWLQVGVL